MLSKLLPGLFPMRSVNGTRIYVNDSGTTRVNASEVYRNYRRSQMKSIFGMWRYESDGEQGSRTHYAVRDNAAEPCGEERMDFRTGELARKFVRESNALIFRTMNDRQNAHE